MEKSTSMNGSFLNIDSYGELFTVNIQNSYFNEGFSKGNGSGFYIDSSKQKLKFTCLICKFNNLFLLNGEGSAIKIM